MSTQPPAISVLNIPHLEITPGRDAASAGFFCRISIDGVRGLLLVFDQANKHEPTFL